MDAMIGNMRSTIGTSVRKIFSNNPGKQNNDKGFNNGPEIKMNLCSICELEGSSVPFIVRDICKFISQKSMKLEGIFRVSASTRQINELRELYESNTNISVDLLLNKEVTEVIGHAAAGLLKQFFRQLPEPLIHEEILRVFVESKTMSDIDFCDKVSCCMDGWPSPHRCTLTFLLTFLHSVAQESENRMSVNGLAVVFGPNVFKLPDGIEGLQAQAVANQTFERLLSCSHLLSKDQTPVLKKREPPPRPAPPVFRPLPPTPQDNSSPKSSPRRPLPAVPSGGGDAQKTSTGEIVKPVPAIRTVISNKENILDINATNHFGATNHFDAMPYIDATPDTDITKNPLDANQSHPENGNVTKPDPMPRKTVTAPQNAVAVPHDNNIKSIQKSEINSILDMPERTDAMPQKTTAATTVSNDATTANSIDTIYEEIPEEIIENSDSIEDAKSDNRRDSDSYTILDNSIRQIVQTRLFNSAESSSVSDEADSAIIRSNGLLPSATAGRVAGPKNRRRPARVNKLLNNVRLDEDSEEEGPAVMATYSSNQSEKVDYSNQSESRNITSASETGVSNLKSPISSSAVISTSNSTTTVMTPDSGCIVEDSDYPRNSSPIKSELARLDIGRSLSPVYIPKLNLHNSLDEEDMAKVRDSMQPSTGDIVPQLDLSSVTESVARSEDLKPPKKRELEAQKVSDPTTPPRPATKQTTAKQGTRKKKKKVHQHNKKTHKISEVTPQASDCEIIDDNCDETMEETRDRMMNVLRDNRRIAGRPFDVSKMAFDELKDEKLSMQRELLKFESRHGRPTTKQSKQLMREVYDRYRAVKRSIAAGHAVDENENAIKHDLNDSFLVTRPFPTTGGSTGRDENNSCEESDVTNEGILDSPASDILQQVHEMRGRRRRLRRILREFETERKIQGSNLERRVMRTEYEEYRSIKNKLRNLEIALAKKGVEIP